MRNFVIAAAAALLISGSAFAGSFQSAQVSGTATSSSGLTMDTNTTRGSVTASGLNVTGAADVAIAGTTTRPVVAGGAANISATGGFSTSNVNGGRSATGSVNTTGSANATGTASFGAGTQTHSFGR